ncbi:MAG: cytochrome P450 [Actinomycetota bacterium]|nr:cytochrome P450 [Actinomycetota bacterium]
MTTVENEKLPSVLEGFDLTDQSQFARGFPHEVFGRLRAEAPVLWHPPGRTADGEGFWVLSRYEDMREAADNPVFSAQGGGGRAGGGTHIDDLQTGVHAGVLINMIDDPRHELIRNLVRPVVIRETVQAREPELRAIAADLVERAVAAGSCDFQQNISAPYAIQAIALILGAPREDWPLLVKYGQTLAGFDERNSGQITEDASKTAYAIYEYSKKLIALKRADGASDGPIDLMTVMAKAELPAEADRPLTEYEREAFFCLLLLAGSEPPRNAMAAGVLALAQHPEQWQALRADRSLLPGAIEEMMRWSSPTPYNRRTATEDVTFRDAEIKAGEKITFWWASANRDSAVFTDPMTFDIRREHNPHLACGYGTHSCLGEQLARIEIRLLLEELLDRVERIEVSGEVRWAPSNKHTVTLQMPVTLTAAPTGQDA